MNKILVTLLVLLGLMVPDSSLAQFPERWIGNWRGTMHIYKSGRIVDSVEVSHLIELAADEGSYTWKTEYHSARMPVVKDYTLRTKDSAKGFYIIDEGGGSELACYLMGDKLLSTFEVGGVLLTANYELDGETLLFEVSSFKRDSVTGGGITNYSMNTLQRVVLKKGKSQH